MTAPTVLRALRGRLLWFVDDPETAGEAAHRFIDDGLLVIENGLVKAAGEARDLLRTLPADAEIVDHRPHLIMPGFIDAHIHMPQTQVVASYGAQLMEWLNKYTFVEEQKLAQQGHAEKLSRFFLDELLANGTTTAAVYCSVHPQSAEAFFTESERRNTRMIAGKVMMDRNAPEALTDTAESSYRDSKALIARWHGKGRQLYAITPRFAITSTPEQMAAAGRLAAEHPDCHVQTHIDENRAEIAFARELYPQATDYADIYRGYGLLGPKSLMGHCIHMTHNEWQAFAEIGAVAVFCPTSNLFLGSGLFDWAHAQQRGVKVAVATDIGGGTSYSMLRTMAEAYKVLQLQGQSLSALGALHAITRGNAVALGLDHLIGSFEPGREADVVVLDTAATRAMAHRMETVRDLVEELFVLVTLGDERNVAATYVMGELAAGAAFSGGA
ncbi:MULTISPECIES: guanine deaminase [Bosea]|uniref:guanine deaminase n=1 Tax=Bosea TaxID=85413 RepID=UPI002150693F|nr:MULTISPECIES: guanine deaminase [Bosea]MCR4523639.1 guanine deaminase [Bosea sp. 47.2.35]MDR6826952.1 guanine deaminase [Bosea robiniae]MDR6893662.1 guanine deaminase [Bosea sp. BE109]MDR7136638.1 guanine deaminase [Bosea sp. BE168]MDR7173337.1 guanine deaminase [Bosea sp. BE271]